MGQIYESLFGAGLDHPILIFRQSHFGADLLGILLKQIKPREYVLISGRERVHNTTKKSSSLFRRMERFRRMARDSVVVDERPVVSRTNNVCHVVSSDMLCYSSDIAKEAVGFAQCAVTDADDRPKEYVVDQVLDIFIRPEAMCKEQAYSLLEEGVELRVTAVIACGDSIY